MPKLVHMDLDAKRRSVVRVFVAMIAILIVLACVILVAQHMHVSDTGSDDEPSLVFSSNAPKTPFYILLIGSDSRKDTAFYTGRAEEHAQVNQHSDIMTLLRVDPVNYQLTLVTVPRDTVLAGETSKINDTLLGGDPTQTVNAVERLTGVEIEYYLMTDFSSFEGLVNDINGVSVDVPVKVTVRDPLTAKNVTVKAGDNQTLDGSQALVLARARNEYGDNQDALRQTNVRNIEISMIKRTSEYNDANLKNALVSMIRNTTTNINTSVMTTLAADFATHRKDIIFYSCSGPYEGQINESGIWVIPEDRATWMRLMETVDAGEDPSGIVVLPAFSSE